MPNNLLSKARANENYQKEQKRYRFTHGGDFFSKIGRHARIPGTFFPKSQVFEMQGAAFRTEKWMRFK
jgi:hypothetical protein